MISVIHPSSHASSFGGARVPPTASASGALYTAGPPSMQGYAGMSTGQGSIPNTMHQMASYQLMMAAKAGEQISELYRRRSDSGYTHYSTTGLSASKLAVVNSNRPTPTRPSVQPVKSSGKDFSKPLFVDCSIEYELPNAPKIPKNSLPILMIHPGYKKPVKKSSSAQASSVACNIKGCSTCVKQAQHQQAQPVKRAAKRSYESAMSNDFYKHLNQQAHHAYFDNTSTSSALEALAKRSRLAEEHQKHLFNQQFFQQQQQQMHQALRQHYQQQQQQQQSYYRPDLRISSFQQITPPESLAFWQQQQQLTLCSHPACNATPGYNPTTSLAPPPPMACYPMLPTPLVTCNTPNGFCLGCAQGKCPQVEKSVHQKGIMRSL